MYYESKNYIPNDDKKTLPYCRLKLLIEYYGQRFLNQKLDLIKVKKSEDVFIKG